jgi:hypothetical protein
MSAVDDAVTRQQALIIKMNQTQDRVKVVEGKVDDGVTEISTKLDVVSGKVDYIWTLTDVRFKGIENERAAVYGDIGNIKTDMEATSNDMVSMANMVFDNADEVVRLAYMVEQLAKKQEQLTKKQGQHQFWWNLVMLMMLGIIIMMLGTIIYVVSLPVTVYPFSFPMGPNHAEPVDECKNPTNTIIGGLRCLTDKVLPKPCRNGYACKRDTYPDW